VLEELDVATSDVSVESVEGLVRVRGQVASEADIARVVRAINGVPGVHGVESLMHLPGEPAPNKKPARAAGL
jgi:osmotically-inducible protein OsmY